MLLLSLFVVPFLSRSAVHTSNRIIRDGDDNGSGSATSQRNDEKTFLAPLFLSFLPSLFRVPPWALNAQTSCCPSRPSTDPAAAAAALMTV